ncbi:MAG: nucleobase:cation symporter, family [Mycobacteriales bacterium]|jgi:putative hydroxymethylpyrimidine transporter CytX
MPTAAATATAPGPIEAPTTLTADPPRALGWLDQLGLWANLGISLLIPVTATFLVPAGQSFLATATAIVLGTVLGCLLLGVVARAGAQTGAPTMVLLRGLLGRRGSYAPTVLNLLQCVGWATYEVWVISIAAHGVYDRLPRWVYVLAAGAVATAMALRPLGSVRLLKRIAVVAVVACSAYFLIETLRRPLGPLTGSWTGFWASTDLVIALPVSWIPLVADYSRFSRTGRAAFAGTTVGYAVSSAAFFLLGVLALRAYADAGADVVGALLAVPAGALALCILAVDEVDEAFANIYSTATSVQNIAPRLDRRVLALGVGGLATVLALAVDGNAYEPFLLLIGAVFVPLGATFAVDFYLNRRGRPYRVDDAAPGRWLMALPWLAGFVAYQLTTPTLLDKWPGWGSFWAHAQDALGVSPSNGFSASIVSFAVAAMLAGVAGALERRLVRG